MFALSCAGGTDSTAEVCDGLDNDCNGIVDDVTGLGEPCCPDGSPAGAAPGACNKGVCRPGNFVCDTTKMALVCNGGKGPDANKCDGVDNNCDGQIDEAAEIADDQQIGVACDPPKAPADQPPCKAGATICRGGKAVCDGAVGPKDETCDGIDNNCDGMVDETAPCPTKIDKCVAGICRSPCQGNEFVHCPSGLVCYSGFCVPPSSIGAGGAGNAGGASGASGNGNAGNSGNAGNAGSNGKGPDGGTAGGSSSAGGTGNSSSGGNAGVGGASGAGGPDSGAGASGNGANGTGTGASGNGANGNGTGASGNGTGAKGNPNDVYGLATGGGGCACRTGGHSEAPKGALSLAIMIGLALSARRRGRRAA
jgi:MYXO-CTERM domain-containing protein